MYEATFHVRGDVAYAAVTAGSDATVELWCNDHCDLLHVRADPEGAVTDAIADGVGVADALVRDGERIVVTEACLRPHVDGNVDDYLERHDCLLLPPLRYEDGGKLVRVLTLTAENLTHFYEDLGASFDVTVRSKREVETVTQERPLLSLESLLPGLSERQEAAVVSAWEAGYYAIPRETTTAALAAEMGVDRRTFEEHLRLAEEKLVGTIVAERFA